MKAAIEIEKAQLNSIVINKNDSTLILSTTNGVYNMHDNSDFHSFL